MQIREVESPEELKAAYEVFHELRTNLSFEEFMAIYRISRERDGYTVVVAIDEGNVVGAMGYRTLYDLVHRKHLYIDDLTTTKERRSSGIGAKLLKHAESIAKEQLCTGLRLSTGTENTGGRKFYEREEWTLRSVVYKKKI